MVCVSYTPSPLRERGTKLFQGSILLIHAKTSHNRHQHEDFWYKVLKAWRKPTLNIGVLVQSQILTSFGK